VIHDGHGPAGFAGDFEQMFRQLAAVQVGFDGTALPTTDQTAHDNPGAQLVQDAGDIDTFATGPVGHSGNPIRFSPADTTHRKGDIHGRIERDRQNRAVHRFRPLSRAGR